MSAFLFGAGLAMIPVVFALLHRASKRPVSPDGEGWVHLHPTAGLVALGVLTAVMALVLATGSFTSLYVLAAPPRPMAAGYVLMFASFAILMSALSIYSAIMSLVALRVRGSFNKDGLLYKGILKSFTVGWNDIVEAKDDQFFSRTIRTRRHGSLLLANCGASRCCSSGCSSAASPSTGFSMSPSDRRRPGRCVAPARTPGS